MASSSAFGQVNEQEHDCVLTIPESGLSMFLADRTKTIHFIRHAEGIHNAANAKAGNNTPTMISTPGAMEFWDAPLTPHGISQCERVREELARERQCNHHAKQIELVVVSPLTRTLETAVCIFGTPKSDGVPPFVVHELCRERTGLYTCDGRRPIREKRLEFPAIDFDRTSFVSSDEDAMWTEQRELDADCTARGIAFVKWLAARPEREIAVVTHSSFLRHLFSQFGSNTVKEDQDALKRLAGNAELRSVVICSHSQPPSTRTGTVV